MVCKGGKCAAATVPAAVTVAVAVTIPADGNLAKLSKADIAALVTQFEATAKTICDPDPNSAACAGQ